MNLVVGSASYDETTKAQFKREAMKLLREVAKLLRLEKGTFGLKYNPAGIACSGDATLHTDRVYVTLNLDCNLGVLVRTCKSKKDYIGGPNRWYSFAQLKQEGAAGLAEFIRKVRGC